MRDAAGTSVVGAPDVSITSAYTEQSICLVHAPSTTVAGAASGVVYTSSMRMMSVTVTCFHRTPWGSDPTSTLWPSHMAPSIMLRMGGCALVSLRFCTKELWGCAQFALCPPLPTVRRSVWATTVVPSQPHTSGSSLLLSTPVLMTMAALPPALLCPSTSVPLVLFSAAHPPGCSRPQLNRRNSPERGPATAPRCAPRPLLLYASSSLFSTVLHCALCMLAP